MPGRRRSAGCAGGHVPPNATNIATTIATTTATNTATHTATHTAMKPQHLRLAINGRLATITQDQSAARNAMSRALMGELLDPARSISERSDVDVVILTGR